jgi:hypothetical protein
MFTPCSAKIRASDKDLPVILFRQLVPIQKEMRAHAKRCFTSFLNSNFGGKISQFQKYNLSQVSK